MEGGGRERGREDGREREGGLTRLNRMVVECTRISVKIKSETYQFMINQSN